MKAGRNKSADFVIAEDVVLNRFGGVFHEQILVRELQGPWYGRIPG